ncbi:ATP-binding protein [Streptomyces sp. ACA25]|uniref:ATP-binding protein n=1 Tax=Streptomyces sp. ACA25 TaxID=3022596 RepID=UPI0023072759|nr:ATP-binding protein [Streptomyces sp. ACA25]MDB1088417.1 ATP-binding protein [Streptomyces sp. ACA25]
MNDESPRAELSVLPGTFDMMFTSTRRGARLARLLAVERLDAWGIPYDSAASGTVALLVAELAANAVRHGQIPGRDFRLGLTVEPAGRLDGVLVRIEVSDARSERRPRLVPAASCTADLYDRTRTDTGPVPVAGASACSGGRGTVTADSRDLAENGRGLLLISALSSRWGVADREVGKTVWCECVLEPGRL